MNGPGPGILIGSNWNVGPGKQSGPRPKMVFLPKN